MNERLEKLYNQMDITPNIRLKSYMQASIILVEQNRDTDIEELDGWILEEIQLLSDLINRKPIAWCIRKSEV